MTLTPHDLLLPFLWLANGLLTLLYLLLGQATALLLLPLLGWLAATAPAEQRPWTLSACALAILAIVVAPMPVPALLLLVCASGLVAIRLERFNPASLRWRVTSGIALYALMALGFSLYQLALPALSESSSPMLLQGQTYLGVLVSVAMYFYPLGFLALLAQSIWVHPPLAQSPESLIHTIRARGQK